MEKQNKHIIRTGNYSWIKNIKKSDTQRFYFEFNGKRKHFKTYHDLVKFALRFVSILRNLGQPYEFYAPKPRNSHQSDYPKDLTDAELKAELGLGSGLNNRIINHLEAEIRALEPFLGLCSCHGAIFCTDTIIKKEFLTNPLPNPDEDYGVWVGWKTLPQYAYMVNLTDEVQKLILAYYDEEK